MKKLWQNLAEMIFPARCVNCGQLGAFLCPRCDAKIVPIKAQNCPFCNKISTHGKTCPRCRAKNQLTGVLVFGYFKDPILKKAIWNYKYHKLSAMAPMLSEKIISRLKTERLRFDVVVPVPISKKRKTWRGFNQSELLAKNLAQDLNKPLSLDLIKIKDTKTQVGLSRKDRQKNLTGAYEVKNDGKFLGQKVLLIDDVITTGATLNECAKVLRKNGAKSVWAATLAKE